MAAVKWLRELVLRIARLWGLVVLCAALGGAAGCAVVMLTTSDKPLVVADIHEVSDVVLRGGVLELDTTLRRDVDCGAFVDRWIGQDRTIDGRARTFWYLLSRGGNPPTELHHSANYVLMLPLPASLPPGDWFYYSRTEHECNHGSLLLAALFGRPVRLSRKIPFRIAERAPGDPIPVVASPSPAGVLVLPPDETPKGTR